MSLRDYLTYRRLEKEFDPNEFRNKYIGDPELYIKGIREGKRNAVERIAKNSLITLATLVTLAGSALYLHKSEETYNQVVSEAAMKADLNGDGQISGTREMAEFYSNLPGLINFARW